MKHLNLLLILILFFFSCNNLLDYPYVRSVAIYGDSQANHLVHTAIAGRITNYEPEAVFHAGDLVQDGLNKSHWDIFNDIASDMMKIASFYPALGNHEKESVFFFDNFILPNNERWYSVDVGSIHFIVLDSNANETDSLLQDNWLLCDLINADSRYIIVILHHPAFVLENGRTDLFEKYGVNAVFLGHRHYYERSYNNGIMYVITGGGSGTLDNDQGAFMNRIKFIKEHHFCLIKQEDNILSVMVINASGAVIDSFDIK